MRWRFRARAAPTCSPIPPSSCSRWPSIWARAEWAASAWPEPIGLPGARPATAEAISIPVVKETLGRIINITGEAVDKAGELKTTKTLPIHRPAPAFEQQSTKVEMFETGIKVVDLLEPYTKGGKTGLFGGAGV